MSNFSNCLSQLNNFLKIKFNFRFKVEEEKKSVDSITYLLTKCT